MQTETCFSFKGTNSICEAGEVQDIWHFNGFLARQILIINFNVYFCNIYLIKI